MIQLPNIQDLLRNEYPSRLSPEHKIKKKRKRTTAQQLSRLLEIFEINPLPTSKEREALGQEINMSAREVQVWFQNKRQNEKRLNNLNSSGSSSDDKTSENGEASEDEIINFAIIAKLNGNERCHGNGQSSWIEWTWTVSTTPEPSVEYKWGDYNQTDFAMIHSLFLFGWAFALDYTPGGTNYCANKAFYARNCVHDMNPTAACCTVLMTEFNNQGCFCNKIAVGLLGTTLKGPPNQVEIATLFAKCGGVPKDCSTYGKKTYNGGTCPYKDEDMDFYRFAQGKKFSDALLAFADQITCFDYNSFKNTVQSVFKPDAVAYAGQGLGTYQGTDHIAEYFSLLAPKVNRGFVSLSHSTEPTAVVAVRDPNSLTMGFWISNKFADGAYSRTIKTIQSEYTDYLEMTFTFNGCDLVASKAVVPANSEVFQDQRTTGVVSLTDLLYRTVNPEIIDPNNANLANLGIVSICKQHTRFCTGSNAQFSSEADCLNYYRSIPRYSATCGTAAIAAGNSVTCRAKHQFMAAISPAVHCPHIGRNSAMCQDNLCQNPGQAASININNWPSDMNTKLVEYANKMAYDFSRSGQWRYSDYCPSGYRAIGQFNANTIAASTRQVWATDTSGNIFKWNGASWTQIPGVLTQVVVCPNEQVYGVNSANNIFNYNPAANNWNVLPGLLSTIACGFDGFSPNGLYGVNAYGSVFTWSYLTGNWIGLDGTLSPNVGSIAVGGGKVWGLNSGNYIFYRSATMGSYGSWVNVPGLLKGIAAGPAGVAGVNSNDDIFRWTGSGWNLQVGKLRYVAVNDLFLYGTNVYGTAFQRSFSELA